MERRVLVVGGGVAGLAASKTLAENGLPVLLIEKEPYIGGWAASYCCKAVEDECSRCGVCLAGKWIEEAVSDPMIEISTGSQLISLEGELGRFRAKIRRAPAYIDLDRCIGCGTCFEVCPAEPKAIKLAPDPSTAPYHLDINACLHFKEGCDRCAQACPTGAIRFDGEPEDEEIEADAVIIATGFEPFDAGKVERLGYGRYDAVLTGLDLERLFRERGPEALSTISDGRDPQRIAFVQCVGSRDKTRGYCSQVCCKYAVRFAAMIKSRNPSAEVKIFYIDLQSSGKGFAEFYEEHRDEIGFVRGVPVEVGEAASGALEVRFEDISTGRVKREPFDLVVLSVGMVPRRESWELALKLGINLNEHGFFEATDANETNVKGVFVAGACEGPKDIPDSITHGMAAAEKVMEVLRRCE